VESVVHSRVCVRLERKRPGRFRAYQANSPPLLACFGALSRSTEIARLYDTDSEQVHWPDD
jgi:hypothetical protein